MTFFFSMLCCAPSISEHFRLSYQLLVLKRMINSCSRLALMHLTFALVIIFFLHTHQSHHHHAPVQPANYSIHRIIMAEQNIFRVQVDLSEFYIDYRRSSYICVDYNWERVEQLHTHLKETFHINRFYLVTKEDVYLPSKLLCIFVQSV